MQNNRITSIESATLTGKRPRPAGHNARLAIHGIDVRVPIIKITTEDGTIGFGYSRATMDQLKSFIGMEIGDLINAKTGIQEQGKAIEFPLWDWLGQHLTNPVYKIIAEQKNKVISDPFHVRCYDTSLYIDDLHLNTDEEGANLIADEARFGYERGHRAFKIKVGRGSRHMDLDAGTRRDIAVIKAVRDAVGADCTIMIDANNGYNLNIAKRVLAQTAECNLYWIEEAFHEDQVLYEDLSDWLDTQGLQTRIADGEGQASPLLMEWASNSVVDVVQYDIFDYGLSQWIETGSKLDSWNILSAPHHYGRHLGNYVSGHLAGGMNNFALVEWDEVTTPGIDASEYKIQEGQVHIPDKPGFGIELDDEVFKTAVENNGFRLSLNG